MLRRVILLSNIIFFVKKANKFAFVVDFFILDNIQRACSGYLQYIGLLALGFENKFVYVDFFSYLCVEIKVGLMTIIERDFMERVIRLLPKIADELSTLNKRLEKIENTLNEKTKKEE